MVRRVVVSLLVSLSLLATNTASAATYVEVRGRINFAGYSVDFTNPKNTPLGVGGSWTVPAVSCRKNGKAISGHVAVFVGLGGVKAGNQLEQIGTDSECVKGVSKYRAWYEVPPSKPVYFTSQNGYPVSAGDAIRADVTDQGAGQFVFRLSNENQNWNYVKILIDQSTKAVPLTAEWVVEDPGGSNSWPQFDHVLFTRCTWAQNSPLNPLASGSNITRYTILDKSKKQKSTTLDIFPSGTEFSVYWNRF